MAMMDFPFAVTLTQAPQCVAESHFEPENAVPYTPDGSL